MMKDCVPFVFHKSVTCQIAQTGKKEKEKEKKETKRLDDLPRR
jgi:hypothetical protein